MNSSAAKRSPWLPSRRPRSMLLAVSSACRREEAASARLLRSLLRQFQRRAVAFSRAPRSRSCQPTVPLGLDERDDPERAVSRTISSVPPTRQQRDGASPLAEHVQRRVTPGLDRFAAQVSADVGRQVSRRTDSGGRTVLLECLADDDLDVAAQRPIERTVSRAGSSSRIRRTASGIDVVPSRRAAAGR